MRKLLLIFLLIIFSKSLNAAVFTVVSNEDDGAGSLREAISLANANGTTVTDYIHFNLSGNNASDVTITLESELPILSSNLIIDGTSQPFSAFLNPNIKIALLRVVDPYFNGLRLDNANHVEIYGISFSNFRADPLGPIEEKKGAIYLCNSADIIIGAPGKPNCFGGNYAGILSPFVIPRKDVQRIKISSNIFGLGENGINNVANESGIDVSFLKNSVIGGDSPQEGNLIANNLRNGIALGGADGTIKIANNIVGLDKNLVLKASMAANGIYVNGSTCIPNIFNNTIAGQAKGILLDYVNGGFTIVDNHIGTGLLGTESYPNEIGIHINFCLAGTIGGLNNSDANTIAFNKTAVIVEISYPISILKNSIYCNDAAITLKNLPLGKVVTRSRITTINATTVSGTYLPNSKIELFYVDDCGDCEGKTWIATIATDNVGKWAYSGSITGKVTSTGTNQDGATSTFSKPFINDSGVQKFGTYCGLSTAAIKNLEVYDANIFRWYDAAGNLVGVSKNLEGVTAGTYYLKAGQDGACDVTSASYTIDAKDNGIDDTKKIITDELCGASNGSIKGIGIVNDLPKRWYSASGNFLTTADDLENVPAGSYYFKAGVGVCEITSEVYMIKNTIKNFKVKNFEIVPSSCGKKNGKIIISNYQADIPTKFEWTSQSGELVGNDENLIDVLPGTYTLNVSDGNNCADIAGTFTVGDEILPIIDLTNLQSHNSCDGKNLSITGIEVNGTTAPYHYRWIDENNDVVSIELLFKGLKIGKYQLLVADKFGCEVRSRFIDFNQIKNIPLQIPNAITPNGDGINDTWQITGSDNYPNAEFSIYNRLGMRIFYSKGYPKPFDGVYQNQLLAVGVYYYVIDLKTDCGIISGSLTILQ
ncbi:gliding motility-associated C-terminal domain-containing protein [uncultured Pedobacter sp.]|uniref:gliding motility-associated C-terminal domain-containing protein n=1 Tax=uncultured Pedobacter sp. TaxID=246139 RepID=UPI0025D17D85|nr:gliding motility-associated C-terminal domain-containing protein [uncultured Pedobacter sp.]